jgi:hypothetical protein
MISFSTDRARAHASARRSERALDARSLLRLVTTDTGVTPNPYKAIQHPTRLTLQTLVVTVVTVVMVQQ